MFARPIYLGSSEALMAGDIRMVGVQERQEAKGT